MKGSQYRARVTLYDKQGEVLCEAGDTCERMTAEQLSFKRKGEDKPWLLVDKLIEPITAEAKENDERG